MKASFSLPCLLLLLLTLDACFPSDGRKDPGGPSDSFGFAKKWQGAVGDSPPGWPWGASTQKKDPNPLFGLAKEPQGFGKERASFGFRFGRQEEESPGAHFVPASGEKRSGLLGNLAEELNGYRRKKGGFSFRFGRR
ncbi:orexigenic neuropeptide QRFP [Ornithorhynchus anatinus]|uniref:orexigenic neuropeptide QRFP n=1 Tax=Ornithorhynchus anatinus TaxID=9258 RepID=UPI0000EDE4E8|nr:orexigenic neuropeptide QRFP [Ornithorhynchus anatinus]